MEGIEALEAGATRCVVLAAPLGGEPKAAGFDDAGFDDAGFDDAEFEAMVSRWAVEQCDFDETQDCLDTLLETRAAIASLQAREQRTLARLDEIAQQPAVDSTKADSTEIAWRSMVAEIAVATRTADRTVQAMLGRARALATTLPMTLEALETGRISMGHARVILEHSSGIEGAALDEYERVTITRAEATTPGKLAASAKIAAARLRAETFEDRHASARALRRVTISELDDGMSELTHVMPSIYAAAVFDRLTRQAKAVAATGDPRSRDELRSDIALDLLLTGEPDGGGPDDASADDSSADDSSAVNTSAPHSVARGIRAEVSIVIPALALLGLDDAPATLAGRGPIELDTACGLAANAPELIRVLTHPVSGVVVSCDNYRPTASLRRYLEARDGFCRFPSCHRDARYCDIDHTLAWEHGGTTVPENLALLCRGHHTLKHHSRWRVRQVTPGVLEWISPLGRTVTTEPPGAAEASGASRSPGPPRFADLNVSCDADESPAPF